MKKFRQEKKEKKAQRGTSRDGSKKCFFVQKKVTRSLKAIEAKKNGFRGTQKRKIKMKEHEEVNVFSKLKNTFLQMRIDEICFCWGQLL